MGKGLGIRVISTILVIALLFGVFLVTANCTVSADQAGDYTYDVSNGKAVISGYTGPGGNITIPATLGGYPIDGILSEAFASHPLTSVTIPNGVTYIGDHAFQRCGNLTLVVIPSSVTVIYLGAFAYCTSLASVTIPNNVTCIWASAFFGCTSLTSITIPNSVRAIGQYCFENCYSLTRVTISEGVVDIGDFAFCNCPSLNSIVFLGQQAPLNVGANWISNTNTGITGHAYHDSNFPAPGETWHGLTMGSELTPVTDIGTILILIAVIAIAVLLVAAMLVRRSSKGKK